MISLIALLLLADPGGHTSGGSCERKVTPTAQCIIVERKHAKLYTCDGDCFYPGRPDGGYYSKRVKASAESREACIAKLVCG